MKLNALMNLFRCNSVRETYIVQKVDVEDSTEDKNRKTTKGWYINRTSSVSEMNEQFPDSLFAPPHCPADCHCLWNRHCHPEVILALNISLGLTLFVVFMLGSMLMKILPLPHRLPGCLLRRLLLLSWTWAYHWTTTSWTCLFPTSWTYSLCRTWLLLHSQ